MTTAAASAEALPAEPPWSTARTAYLYPGELYVSAEPVTVTTILGTCVAVCLWDAGTGVGGMNHYLLPQSPREGERSARFGDVAIPALIRGVLDAGASLGRLRAKVFGGMSSRMTFPRDIGTANVQLALGALRDEGIPVASMDAGGARGRKLVFQVHDGRAWVRQL